MAGESDEVLAPRPPQRASWLKAIGDHFGVTIPLITAAIGVMWGFYLYNQQQWAETDAAIAAFSQSLERMSAFCAASDTNLVASIDGNGLTTRQRRCLDAFASSKELIYSTFMAVPRPFLVERDTWVQLWRNLSVKLDAVATDGFHERDIFVAWKDIMEKRGVDMPDFARPDSAPSSPKGAGK
ncbi:MAG TPA: hypothetical protein VMF53_03575 [Alphaproteobacteria bacterium]|nr:hypothetical protein [Alphaproteobacteria bacterium]